MISIFRRTFFALNKFGTLKPQRFLALNPLSSNLNSERMENPKNSLKIIHVDFKNIDKTIPLMEEDINNCDIMSLDTEFISSLVTQKYLTPEDKYLYLQSILKSTLLFQIGVSLFKKDKIKENKYKVASYSVNVAPKSFDNVAILTNIHCIKFMAENDMNFKEIFSYPIKFYSKCEMDQELKQLYKYYSRKAELVSDYSQKMNFHNIRGDLSDTMYINFPPEIILSP
ncbi:MAG: Poly(A)-specific ribonuclease pnldc1 [Marteilia pararefringens]